MKAIGIFNYAAYKKYFKGKTGVFVPFIQACANHKIELECKWFDRKLLYRYNEIRKTYKNMIMWGSGDSHEKYMRREQNILFFENGYLPQTYGFFIDADGLYADSSIGKGTCDCNLYEEKYLREHVKRYMGFELFQGNGKSNDIVVALQYETDANLRYYFRCNDEFPIREILRICNKYLSGFGTVYIRPHPRYVTLWEKRMKYYTPYFKPNWVIDVGVPLYVRLATCGFMATVNSTSGIEAMAAGLQVGVLGKGVFTTANSLLDCSDDFSKLVQLKSVEIEQKNKVRFLCHLLAHHIPWDYTAKEIEKNLQFQKWVSRCKE